MRIWRKKKGFSLDSLAGQANMNKSHLSELERGKTNPSLTTVMRLADALGVNGSIFFLAVSEAKRVHEILGLAAEDLPEDLEASDSN